MEGHYPPFLRSLVAFNLQQDYRQAAALIVPSVPRCRLLLEQYHLPSHKVHLVLNGAEPVSAPPVPTSLAKSRLGLTPESFCLGYVGTVNERYDFDTLLTALAQALPAVPYLSLIVVGAGPDLSRVQSLAQALGLQERVIFTGFIPQEQLHEILPALDLGFMTLTTQALLVHGPIHTKLGTYALHGLPVITAGFTLNGYPQELSRAVFLVPPEDPRALTAMITRLYQQPRERQAAALRLQQYVRDHLTWRHVAGEILQIMAQTRLPR
jgi:glycosyltransferase involved in cell wall biosynthesis